MTWGHVAVLQFATLYVLATQFWAWLQPDFQSRRPVRITFRVGNPPGGVR